VILSAARGWWALERQQWIRPGRLEALRDARLRELVAHAHATVPYYRRLFRSQGLTPGDIVTAGDLWKLPVLTRAMLRDAPPGDFLAEGVDPGRCLVHGTSGSTGQVLTLYRAGSTSSSTLRTSESRKLMPAAVSFS
jgi:phenylacetate-CoA ligase